ncbi:hypothetical protein H1C71_009923 [Ictidomys tridecemlineatus]|nr:hypothetical protein H1C71_009923 [Ictidomys tridecemlineatus]KAG3286335.1 hypothetical protein H1C71_009923 [Ictidomys tridecemlineatus]KAG3286336.1 hypothetical protein H1C71_009923 [Ictidomys tridecemlineatus]KAG3286337.1 hypothetical protein H1C71_009923 [Ictidomys tridecemlineatus]KAG3286338.1 hypothetical protein H1C71_009923 [Ictidomys tridecemlineatus]
MWPHAPLSPSEHLAAKDSLGREGEANEKWLSCAEMFLLLRSKQEHPASLVFDLIKVSPLFLGGNRERFISKRAIHLMVHFMCLSDFKAVCVCVCVCVCFSHKSICSSTW